MGKILLRSERGVQINELLNVLSLRKQLTKLTFLPRVLRFSMRRHTIENVLSGHFGQKL